MLDFLNTIDEKDKYIDKENINLSAMKWNYKVINKNLNNLIVESKDYLKKSIM